MYSSYKYITNRLLVQTFPRHFHPYNFGPEFSSLAFSTRVLHSRVFSRMGRKPAGAANIFSQVTENLVRTILMIHFSTVQFSPLASYGESPTVL